MRASISKLVPVPLTIALVLPMSAAAAYVPPDNSAATQYTEAVPTAGGPKKIGGSKRGQSKDPGTVLGKHNAKRLDSQGQAGREAAEVAAATAPSDGAGSANSGNASQPGRPPEASGQGSAGPGSQGGGEEGPGAQSTGGAAPSSEPQGSSALGEVASDVTGSDSGGTGLLLPLAIVAAILGSIAYLLRQRRRQAS
jgi:hypothetical protein